MSNSERTMYNGCCRMDQKDITTSERFFNSTTTFYNFSMTRPMNNKRSYTPSQILLHKSMFAYSIWY